MDNRPGVYQLTEALARRAERNAARTEQRPRPHPALFYEGREP